jgi:hypothetical protein
MVAENCGDRNAHAAQFLREHTRFFREPVVRQVARDQQNLSRFGHSCEQGLEGALRRPGAVQIPKCGHSNDMLGHKEKAVQELGQRQSRFR